MLKIIKEYKLNKLKTLYIGDVLSDKTAAEAAGIQFIYEDELEKILK